MLTELEEKLLQPFAHAKRMDKIKPQKGNGIKT
jgi:hypothetical protein